jgi:hypothetical protein
MIQISYWAKANKIKAQILFTLLAFAQAILGSFIGQNTLSWMSERTSTVLILAVISIFVFLEIIYKKADVRQTKRQIMILGMVCTVSLSLLLGARWQYINTSANTTPVVVSVISSKIPFSNETIKVTPQQSFKSWIKQMTNHAPEGEISPWYMILGALLLLVLAYFSLFLACSIVCNGNAVLGYALAFTTTSLSITSLYYVFYKAIAGIPFKKKSYQTKDDKEENRMICLICFLSSVVTIGLILLYSSL